jgi:ABC-2 type transport system permease protein
LDDAVAGSGKTASWLLCGAGVIATGAVMWLAFGKLAQDYHSGMQALNETVSQRGRKRAGTRWIERLIDLPPLRWWLKDPVARASFLLSAAYLVRDRDVKLRIYPGVAPILIMPFILLMQRQGAGEFGIAFSGCYAGLIPMMTVGLLQYSQQWKAADVFRAAPMPGPGPLCDGARRAVLLFITVPMVLILVLIVRLLHGADAGLFMLLPGIIAMPVYALAPSLGGKGVPLSQPVEEAKAAGRGLVMFGMMMVAVALSGLAILARSQGWFWWLIAVETVATALVYAILQRSVARARWTSLD